MADQRGVPDRREARLAITSLAVENEEFAGCRQRGRVIGMIGGISEAIEHHDSVGDRRENPPETVLAVETFGRKRDGLVYCSLPHIGGEIGLDPPQQSIEYSKGPRQ